MAIQVISPTGFVDASGCRTSFTDTGRLDIAIGAAAGLHEAINAKEKDSNMISWSFIDTRDFTRICF